VILDPNNLGAPELYKILIGTVVPRPIGWASTLSVDGVANLAPFSFFTVVSRKPPMVSLTIQPRSDLVTLKDTLVNARDTGEFVVNIVSLAQVNQMHVSSVEYPPDADEFDITGLQKVACEIVKPPRVANAPVSLECKVERITPMGEVGDHVLIGRVVRIHIRDDIWLPENGRVDTAAFQPIGRLAAEYTLADALFACPIDDELIASREGMRGTRIDQKDSHWSPVDEKTWSASGNTNL
jgi:flavin reductase (DIM6/NTAB) family NADH-FMN oxidoreductase RutF